MKSELTGTVLCGANNIFTVRSETPAPAAPGETYECRIKGKILKNAEADYNPLCPGDSVCFLPAPETHGAARREGVLLSRGERKNVLLRWNKKGRGAQAIAANVDLLVCIASPVSPPFRPRFLDRLLIAASLTSIPAALCINKCGQGTDEDMEERLADYASRGLPIVRTELTPEGHENLASLGELIRGKRVVFAGQSGVGKTSILNRLAGAKGKVGSLSEKYNRGRHTTVLSHLAAWEGGEIIDTPGVREFDICGISSPDLASFFTDFVPVSPACRLPGCTHTHEPDCAVRRAAEEGLILADRYESYLRIYESLLFREKLKP